MGRHIAARRELMGLDVETLAKRSGVPLMRLQAYEDGLRRVVPDDFFRLCRALEASPATFLAGLPEPGDSTSNETETHR